MIWGFPPIPPIPFWIFSPDFAGFFYSVKSRFFTSVKSRSENNVFLLDDLPYHAQHNNYLGAWVSRAAPPEGMSLVDFVDIADVS